MLAISYTYAKLYPREKLKIYNKKQVYNLSYTNVVFLLLVDFKEINIEFGRFVVQNISRKKYTSGKVYSWGIIFWTY